MTASDHVSIVRGGAERIPELAAFWETLRRHHVSVAPEITVLAPPLSPEVSWARRRQLYERWLADPDTFVLIAIRDGTPAGYALVRLIESGQTWDWGERVAELETLAVLPEHRGRGVGHVLMERVFAELRRLGVRHVGVAAIASNHDALRFYERYGLIRFTTSLVGRVPEAGVDT